MGLRSPSEAIQLPILEELKALKWHTLECELVTPMYGGGVDAAIVDLKMPIRVSAIKGQLRFWWRLLAKNKKDDTWSFNGDLKRIRDAEFALWGGQGDDDGGRASKLFFRVKSIKNLLVAPWAIYNLKRNSHDYKNLPDPEDWANVPYALFPAQGKKPGYKDSRPAASLAKSNLKWELEYCFSNNITQQEKEQFLETLNYWANFGGLGARTRRGLGAIRVKGEHIYTIALDSLAHAGIKFETTQGWESSAYIAWKKAVEKLQTFRQGYKTIEIGRNQNFDDKNMPGRSRWPEPDAIRSITNQSSVKHSKRLTQADFFPRAAFGLPIIFKFKDDGTRSTDEPQQSSLQPLGKNGELLERMTSPLILRPYFNGEAWQAIALVLPHDYLNNLSLKLVFDKSNPKKNHEVKYWDNEKSDEIKPIHQFKATNALDAFLKYFAK